MVPVCQVLRETRFSPTRSEISWLNAPSSEPPNITNTLVSPNNARVLLPEVLAERLIGPYADAMTMLPAIRDAARRIAWKSSDK